MKNLKKFQYKSKDETYVIDSMKNPEKLQFTQAGSVVGEYDGSQELTIDVGAGGGGIQITASENEVVKGVSVPKLSVEEVQKAYNALASGSSCLITDANGNNHYQVIESKANGISFDIVIDKKFFLTYTIEEDDVVMTPTDIVTKNVVNTIDVDASNDNIVSELGIKNYVDGKMQGTANRVGVYGVDGKLTSSVVSVGELENLKGTTSSIQGQIDNAGHKVQATYNNSNYILTISLLDKNSAVLSNARVSVPLESVVVGGRYDAETKSIILTLQNQTEISIPVADLIGGLVADTRKIGSNDLKHDITAEQISEDIKYTPSKFGNKDIDADLNNIYNLELENFKEGVVDQVIDSTAHHTHIASTKAIKDYVDAHGGSIGSATINGELIEGDKLGADYKLVDIEQGAENKGKTLRVNDSGNLELVDDMFGSFTTMNKIAPYTYETYYTDLNYDYAMEQLDKASQNAGGCSTMRKGNLLGRNYDWLYNEQAEFIVHTPHAGGRNASTTICGNLAKLTQSFVDSGEKDDAYILLPFMVMDGVNEHGLGGSVLVVPKGEQTQASAEISEKTKLNSSMVLRYVLDNFKTASEATSYLRDYTTIVFSKPLRDKGYDVHFVIADDKKTYLVEFIDGNTQVIDISDTPYVTNFNRSGVTLNADNTVYTPNTQDAEHNAVITNNVNEYGSGLERFNIMATSGASLRSIMNELNYTNTYSTESGWLTEFVGGDLKVNSEPSAFDSIRASAIEKFNNRSRNPESENYGTWQTTHSAVYDLKNKTLSCVFQESGQVLEFGFDNFISGMQFKRLEAKSVGGVLGIYDEDTKLTMQEIKELYKDPNWFVYLEYLNIVMIPEARYLDTSNAFEFGGQFQENGQPYQARVIINNENVVQYNQISLEHYSNKAYDIEEYDEDNEEQYFNAITVKENFAGKKLFRVPELEKDDVWTPDLTADVILQIYQAIADGNEVQIQVTSDTRYYYKVLLSRDNYCMLSAMNGVLVEYFNFSGEVVVSPHKIPADVSAMEVITLTGTMNTSTLPTMAVPKMTKAQVEQAYTAWGAGKIVKLKDSIGEYIVTECDVASKEIRISFFGSHIAYYLEGDNVVAIYEKIGIDKIEDENIAKSISNTGAVDTKLTTEKAVADVVGNMTELKTTEKDNLVKAINEVASIETYKFKGYVASAQPTGTIQEGELWYLGSTMPTTFPISVKQYKNGAWSALTIQYTPTQLDLWADVDDNHGYYWFGNSWNLIDVDVSYDNITIDKNASGQLQVKDDGITTSKIKDKNVTKSKIADDYVVDNLTSDLADQPLSAKQGKALNDNKVDKTTTINSKSLDTDIILSASDIKATNTQSVQANLERIDELVEKNIDDIADLNNNKQDNLPEVVNDRYLHTNATTGELEWSEVQGGGGSGYEPDNKTIELNPQGKLQVKNEGITKSKINSEAGVVFEEDIQTLKNKVINGKENTISNIGAEAFDPNMIDTSALTTTDDKHLATSKLIKNYADTKISIPSTRANKILAWNSSGNVSVLSYTKYYKHYCAIKRTSATVNYITFMLETTDSSMTYAKAAKWLYDNGFTSQNALYPAGGLAAANTIYVASVSGGSTSTSFSATSCINGIFSSNGTSLNYTYRAGTDVSIDSARFTVVKTMTGEYKITD